MLRVQRIAQAISHNKRTLLKSSYIPSTKSCGRESSSTLQYEEIYRKSIEKPEEFWAEVSQCVHWFKPWSKVLDLSSSPAQKWYVI